MGGFHPLDRPVGNLQQPSSPLVTSLMCTRRQSFYVQRSTKKDIKIKVLSVRCVMHYYPPLGDRGVGPRVASPVIRVKRIPDIPPFLQPQIGLLFPETPPGIPQNTPKYPPRDP